MDLEPGWEDRCHQLLRSAHLLIEAGDFTSAVSRAYYAMFFAAEILLASKDLSFSSHRAVIGAFGKEFARTGILSSEMHRWLQDAFQDRNTNEYSLRPTVTRDRAASHIEAAEKFVATAEQYIRMLD